MAGVQSVVQQGLEAWKCVRQIVQHSVNVQGQSQKWDKPPVGFLKCNIDADILDQGVAMGAGFVMRNNEGAVVYCGCWKIRGSFSPTLAEALCLKNVLQFMISQGLSNVLIESDAKIVVDGINDIGINDFEMGMIFEYCRELINQGNNFDLYHLRRSANATLSIKKKKCRECF
jgi:ribonuclease HI